MKKGLLPFSLALVFSVFTGAQSAFAEEMPTISPQEHNQLSACDKGRYFKDGDQFRQLNKKQDLVKLRQITNLISAVNSGSLNVVECVFSLNEDMNINAADENGMTALHWISAKHEDKQTEETNRILDFLLEKGVKVNVKDKNGSIPLAFSATNNYKYAAEKLLENGADVNEPDVLGYTPFDEAESYGQKDIVEMFSSHLKESDLTRRVFKKKEQTPEMNTPLPMPRKGERELGI